MIPYFLVIRERRWIHAFWSHYSTKQACDMVMVPDSENNAKLASVSLIINRNISHVSNLLACASLQLPEFAIRGTSFRYMCTILNLKTAAAMLSRPRRGWDPGAGKRAVHLDHLRSTRGLNIRARSA